MSILRNSDAQTDTLRFARREYSGWVHSKDWGANLPEWAPTIPNKSTTGRPVIPKQQLQISTVSVLFLHTNGWVYFFPLSILITSTLSRFGSLFLEARSSHWKLGSLGGAAWYNAASKCNRVSGIRLTAWLTAARSSSSKLYYLHQTNSSGNHRLAWKHHLAQSISFLWRSLYCWS